MEEGPNEIRRIVSKIEELEKRVKVRGIEERMGVEGNEVILVELEEERG